MSEQRKSSGSTSMATTMGFDDFMSYEGAKGGGGGGYLGSWKKDKAVTVFLHRKSWATAFWLHNWPRLVEVEDKETKDKSMRVWGQRWGCHERELVNQKQHFRDKATHERDYPPEVCPICRLVDYLAVLYAKKKIGLTTPVFHFEGDVPDETITLTVGGIIGRYGAKELDRDELRMIKASRIDRSTAYKEDMRTKLKYLYLVVDQEHPEHGVQKTFEGQGLTNKIKKAVTDTRARLTKQKKNAALANPVEHPYPFSWEYDDSQEFDDKFNVVALAEDGGPYEVPDAIIEVISGEAPDISRDIAVGNCFELRGQMEAHLCEGIKLDWNVIFGEAEKRGLMVAPSESKDDVDEGSESAEDGEGSAPVVIKMGPTHEAWTVKGWKPGPEIGPGVEVHTDAPEGLSDEEQDRIEGLMAKAGAIVGRMVTCDHCAEVITTLDSDCGFCGARYDDNGLLVSRPCLKEECKGQCVLTAPGPGTVGRTICETCGVLHEAVAGAEGAVSWQLVPEEVKPVVAAAPARRRPAPVAGAGASSAKAAPKNAPPFG